MKVTDGLQAVAPMAHPVITIGAFDGIHRGHQALMTRVRERARQKSGTAVVLTFDPHPQWVIDPVTAPPLLTERREKLALIDREGIDSVIILPFTQELRQMEAEPFVEQILVGRLGVRLLVMGHDHAFGRRRRGRPELLAELGPRLGFALEVVEPVTDKGEPITSSRIRGRLDRGEVEEAARMLGRPYEVTGIVIADRKRGRSLGYPTANVECSPQRALPSAGVYAVTARTGPDWHKGMCHLGDRPTFQEHRRTVEVHLFDFNRDLYGESMTVRFHSRIRDTQRFPDAARLQQQQQLDETEARKRLVEEVR